MPDTTAKFNQMNLKLYDTTKLDDSVTDKLQWIEDLKKLRWFGPFKPRDNVYQFQTVTDAGSFEGLMMTIYLGRNKFIEVEYLGKDGKRNGANLQVFSEKENPIGRPLVNYNPNAIITFEGVIWATFLNPDRRKFQQNKINGSNYPLHPDNIDPEELI